MKPSVEPAVVDFQVADGMSAAVKGAAEHRNARVRDVCKIDVVRQYHRFSVGPGIECTLFRKCEKLRRIMDHNCCFRHRCGCTRAGIRCRTVVRALGFDDGGFRFKRCAVFISKGSRGKGE